MDRDLERFLEQQILHCADIEELVDYHVDNELPQALEEHFNQHLARCENCRSLVFDITKLVEMARTLDSEPLPSGIGERLRARLNHEIENGAEPRSKLSIVSSRPRG